MFAFEFRIQKVYLTLCFGLHVCELNMSPTKRWSFCKEFKQKVTNWYFENEENIKQTVNNFQIDRKAVGNWLKDEAKFCSLKRSKEAFRYGNAKFPVMENELCNKFLYTRKEGKRVKR